jgi:hypothetical protein
MVSEEKEKYSPESSLPVPTCRMEPSIQTVALMWLMQELLEFLTLISTCSLAVESQLLLRLMSLSMEWEVLTTA